MPKAYGYIRVSGKGQLKGDGLERQRDKIKRYGKANKIDIVGWYKESESGSEQDRPQLARLLVDLESNGVGIRTVIIEGLHRLARDLMVQEAIIRDFNKKGVQLISADEGPELASSDPSRKLIRQMFGAVAEYEKTMLVLKLRAARQRKRERDGKCEGAKAYGENSKEEREVIRRVRLMRRRRKAGHKGMTLQAIAEELNAENIKTKKGRKWTAQLVHHISTK